MSLVDGHTCGVHADRIHELIEECPTAVPPLEDGDTSCSDMEWEEFDQVSCLHPSPLRQKEWFKMTQIVKSLR